MLCLPSALDGKEHSYFYRLHAWFTHGIGAVTHIPLSAFETSVVFEIKEHLVFVSFRNHVADFAGIALWQEPRLKKDIGQKLFIVHFRLLLDDCGGT